MHQFESPLLLYATGSHFQSVFPKDHEFFAKYETNLEKRYSVNSSSIKPVAQCGSKDNLSENDRVKQKRISVEGENSQEKKNKLEDEVICVHQIEIERRLQELKKINQKKELI